MKSIGITLVTILLFCTSNIMSQNLPKDGAILVIKEKSFNLTTGKALTTKIELVKSKRYQKAKFGGLSARTPEGITISFEKDIENSNLYLMTLLADDNASKDSYTIIIKGEGNNSHKVRGITIKVNLDQNPIVTTN